VSETDQAGVLGRDESIMIAAFEGWNDAGSAASAAVDHLARIWRAEQRATLDSDDYHDFQVSRPSISRNASGERVLSWPGTVVSVVPPPGPGGRSVTIVRGIEPSMRWRRFVAELLDLARELGVTTLVTCGALLVDTPHTRPLPTFITADNSAARDLGLESSDYEGPTGITGVLGHEAASRGMGVVSVWVGVPHYVGHPPSPKATLAVVSALERLLGDPIPRGELEIEASAWERGVDELADEDDEVAAHVKQLEDVADTTSLPEASGDAIAAEFERFLRRREQA
jgi:hypothetical protein